MVKLNKKYIIINIVLMVVVAIIIHIIGWNTEAMKASINFVFNDDGIKNNFGNVKCVYMVPFGSNIRMVGTDGKANIELLITGTTAKYSKIKINLVMKDNVWEVISAR